MLDAVFARFVAESPVSVMFRGTLEHVFSAERLDHLFERTAQRQYRSELLFSTCAELLSLVVLGNQKSLHAADRRRRQEVGVSVKAVYDKLAGIETAVSETLVAETAADLAAVIDQLGAAQASSLPGYELRIVDGNHLPATQHRLQELREAGAAPLPGHALAIWDPQRELIEDVLLCEDGHASQRTLLARLVEHVREAQCWIADRHLCTVALLWGLHQRGASLVVRQHGQLPGVPVGPRNKRGRTETGVAYEQAYELPCPEGGTWRLRRISVVLDTPTRNGDHEVQVLTNLPARVSAQRVAQLYRDRWQIEAAFRELATTLRSEINSLGSPPAALFGFCLAVATYNLLNTVRAALRVAAPQTKSRTSATKKAQPRRFSAYYLAEEISGIYRGMMIAIPAEQWTAAFGRLTTCQLAQKLLALAQRVDFGSFSTNAYNPQHRPPKKRLQRRNKGKHVSTHKLLLQRVVART